LVFHSICFFSFYFLVFCFPFLVTGREAALFSHLWQKVNPKRREVCYTVKWGNYETKKWLRLCVFFCGFVQVAAGKQCIARAVSICEFTVHSYPIRLVVPERVFASHLNFDRSCIGLTEQAGFGV